MRAYEFLEKQTAWERARPERPRIEISRIEWDHDAQKLIKAQVTDVGMITLEDLVIGREGALKQDRASMVLSREEALRLAEWIREIYAD